ncbi:hypothetical protein L596_026326 [Steinernema carpocapsae]|uniref:Uncharacterized protein n=1 Tax=Steinernema carpocapsae TaxID=34508 RepID=A0A4U5M124_STECR|nr:hypothetical protein L596_026326 [Steinernema carpocapsae]
MLFLISLLFSLAFVTGVHPSTNIPATYDLSPLATSGQFAIRGTHFYIGIKTSIAGSSLALFIQVNINHEPPSLLSAFMTTQSHGRIGPFNKDTTVTFTRMVGFPTSGYQSEDVIFEVRKNASGANGSTSSYYLNAFFASILSLACVLTL